jgi:uncharacterized membrane protein YqjE
VNPHFTPPADHGSAGLLGSVRALGDGLMAAAENRLGLFSLELREEKLRLIQILIWTSAAVFAGMMAMTFASLVVVYLFWAEARLTVLGGLTVFYLAALLACTIGLRRCLTRQPQPFASTLQEIREDRACIRNTN